MNKKIPITFSCEFFPAKTAEGAAQLLMTAAELAKFQPKYFSVTYGAGGSTQESTFETVNQIQTTTQIETAPHISCVSSTHNKILELLHLYKQHGINHLVALRGDIPSGVGSHLGELQYASDLVHFIRQQTGDHFHIEVAAYPEFHPETTNPTLSLKHFHNKVIAGANSAITQYFYNADGYFRFLDSCSKLNISIPIIPGIMPITNYKQLARFSQLCGAEIPRWLKFRLESFGDDLVSIRQLGEEVVTNLCEKLLQNGVTSLHFYTLNKAQATLAILKNLQPQITV